MYKKGDLVEVVWYTDDGDEEIHLAIYLEQSWADFRDHLVYVQGDGKRILTGSEFRKRKHKVCPPNFQI